MKYIPIKVDERYGYKTEKYRCYMVQTSSYDNSVEAFSHEYKYWFMDLMDKKSIADVWIDGVKNYSACDDCGKWIICFHSEISLSVTRMANTQFIGKERIIVVLSLNQSSLVNYPKHSKTTLSV